MFLVNINVFTDVTPFSLGLLPSGWNHKVPPKRFITTCQTTRRHIPEDSHFHIHRHENFKPGGPAERLRTAGGTSSHPFPANKERRPNCTLGKQVVTMWARLMWFRRVPNCVVLWSLCWTVKTYNSLTRRMAAAEVGQLVSPWISWLVGLLTYLRSWALPETLPIVQPLRNFPSF
jgi:hypothetical protein